MPARQKGTPPWYSKVLLGILTRVYGAGRCGYIYCEYGNRAFAGAYLYLYKVPFRQICWAVYNTIQSIPGHVTCHMEERKMQFSDFLQKNIGEVSLYSLAKQTGISLGQIINYSKGKSEPSLRNADKICRALNTTFLIGKRKINKKQQSAAICSRKRKALLSRQGNASTYC